MATPVAPGTRIGHVHLKVADLDRAIAFYSRRARLRAAAEVRRPGRVPLRRRLPPSHRPQHLGEPRRHAAAAGHTGLYHTAILYPTRADLADALRRLIAAGIPLDGASDHGVSEALYLRDPDGNGVELYWDRPRGRVAPRRRRQPRDGDRAARPARTYSPRKPSRRAVSGRIRGRPCRRGGGVSRFRGERSCGERPEWRWKPPTSSD